MSQTAYAERPLAAVQNDLDDVDLLFVGAGAATAYTLLSLLDSLAGHPPRRPLRIAVVERERDAFAGIPYGDRAARTALLISALRDFLPDEERRLFREWLAQNKTWIFDDFIHSSGELGGRWWARHRGQVARHDFDSLFLPRYVFGTYLTRRVRTALWRARAAGLARTEVIRGEVRSIEPQAGSYLVSWGEACVRARRVVLAIGSAPTSSRLSGTGAGSSAVLLDGPFDEAGMDVDRVREGLQRVPAGRRPHVVLIGGNASTMDMLFQINDLRIDRVSQARFTVLSLRGELPEPIGGSEAGGHFWPENLQRLDSAETVTAVAIYQAALADITTGRQAGLGPGPMLAPIATALGRLLPRLSAEQAEQFAERWGVELGRHQRRAGWEYYEVVDGLRTESRLQTVAGAFVGLAAAEDGGAVVQYEQDGELRTLTPPADVVVNCAGPARDLRQCGHPLLEQLIGSGVCRLTPSGAGIAVDSSFAAAPDFYVMGPLVAGNVVDGRPIWHMEHCGRISGYGATVGAALAQQLTADASEAATSEAAVAGQQ